MITLLEKLLGHGPYFSVSNVFIAHKTLGFTMPTVIAAGLWLNTSESRKMVKVSSLNFTELKNYPG